MLKQLSSYLMIAAIATLAFMFVGCKKDAVTPPQPKTADDIKKENLAELKKSVGTGVSNIDYEVAVSTDQIIKITDAAFDKLKFDPRKARKLGTYAFTLDADKIVLIINNLTIKSANFKIEKKGDEILINSPREEKKEISFSGNVTSTAEYAVKVIYNTKTNKVTMFAEGYDKGTLAGTIITRFIANAYKPATQSIARSVAAFSVTSLTGVHSVNVELQGQTPMAQIAASILKPYGAHNVKFTTLSSGNTQVQFCDASGNVSGDNYDEAQKNDPAINNYHYSSTRHFWKNSMPMSLNLFDVNFNFNTATGEIAPGSNVMAHARTNVNPAGAIPAFFMGNTLSLNSGANAAIINTNGNSATNFAIIIKLDFAQDFHCIITK